MRTLSLSLLLLILPLLCTGAAKNKPVPIDRSYNNVAYRDSIRKVRFDEVDFIIDQIENTYISGRRGLSDEQWIHRKELLYKNLDQLYFYNNEYLFALRYVGLLKNDAHFPFPDNGMLNRHYAFSKTDTIFPLWVQTWEDGTVYNVKDYTGVVPQGVKIVSVNGRSAQDMARMNRAMAPGEAANAMAVMNADYEASPLAWSNFANLLFTSGIKAPFKVIYETPGCERADTVVLKGIQRGEKSRLFKRSGDKRQCKSERGFSRKPVVYENAGDGIGVLTLNSFWGKRWSAMMVFGKDWRYKRLLRQAMRRIDRDHIQHLVIDVSRNPGGMAENIYHTLDYLTDKPVDIRHIYHVTDNNRTLMQTNISRSPELPESDREYLVGYIDTLTEGTVFCTDTVRRLRYTPDSPKHCYHGKVHIMTGYQTYSAAQLFARYCQVLDIGLVAGQHCGGYNDVTGNAAKVTLPSWSTLEFVVPFCATRICTGDDPYDYPQVDIPIEIRFDEWRDRKDRSLERLVERIRNTTDSDF